MSGRPPRWRLRVNADPIGQQSWSILCGLSLLHQRGDATVSFSNLRIPAEGGVWFEARDLDHGTTRSVCIDLADRGELTTPRRAALADSVWKRSWTPGVGRSLGLVAGMRSGHERLARHTASATWTALRSEDPLGRLRRVWSGVRLSSKQLLLAEYERPERKRPVVLFQVTAWPPGSTRSPEVAAAVNERRAELIRSLREHFGPRFVGGFTRTPFTRSEYPELLTPELHHRPGYASLIRSSAVAVSSEGLHGSNPWKLAEYLAGGAAVVSEPLRFAIPESLDGVATFFDGVDRCVAACDELLCDPALLVSANQRSTEYWHAYVRPDALLARRLAEEFAA